MNFDAPHPKPAQQTSNGILDELEHLRAIMDLIPVGVLIIEGDSPATAVTRANNPAFSHILGIPADPGSPGDALPYVHYLPDRCTHFPAEKWPGIRAIRDDEIVRDIEIHLLRADGNWRVVLASASPIHHQGRISGAVIIVHDITEQKNVEEALRESEERFRSLATNAADVIMRLDTNLRYIYANPAIGKASGLPVEYFLGKTNVELGLPPHLIDLWETNARLVFETKRPAKFEYCFPLPHQGFIYYESLLTPELGLDGSVQSLLVVSRDITDRKKVEHALRESEEQVRAHAIELQAVLDAVPSAVVITRDTSAPLIEGNRIWQEALSISRSDIDVTVPKTQDELQQLFRITKNGQKISIKDLPFQISATQGIEVRNYEFDLIPKNGAVKHLLGNSAPLYDDKGNCHGAVAAFIDITERKHAEERMSSLQSITAELAQTFTPVQIGEVIVKQGAKALNASAGLLAVLTNDSTEFEIIRDAGFPTHFTEKTAHHYLDEPTPLAEVIRTGEELLLSSSAAGESAYPQFAPWIQHTHLNSLALFPLNAKGRLFGAIGFGHHGPHSFNSNDLSFMRAMAGQAAQALERSRLYEAELRERNRAEMALTRVSRLATHLDQLQNLAAALSAALTLEEISQVIFKHGLPLLGATGAILSRVVAVTELEIFAQTGLEREAVHTPYRFSLSQLMPDTEARDTPKAIWLGSPAAIRGHYPHPAAEFGLCPGAAWAAIPLLVKDQLLGLMIFIFAEPQEFDEDIQRIASSLANHCALALERTHLYEAERLAHAEAQEANRAKDQFMALISHELRNPLSAIRAGVYILMQSLPLAGRTGRALEIIDRNVTLQARLVNDLLDLSRIARGKLQLQRAPVDVYQVIRAAVQANENEAHEAGLSLELKAENGLWVQGDFDRLQQVVTNLLSNAIKFTPRGGSITVSLEKCLNHQIKIPNEMQRDDEISFQPLELTPGNHSSSSALPSKGYARIMVKDTGIGIDQKLLGLLFNLFQQGEIGTQRQPGLGIGLALVKRITEKLGGQVWAESEGVSQGSRFIVELPLISEPAVKRTPETLHEHEKPVRLLLVEDNPDTRSLIADSLTLVGYEVHTAVSGEDALEVIRESQPDVMLCDIGLPGIDGYEFLRQARNLPSMTDVPAFAVTGYGQEEDVRRGKQAGFMGHFVKPVDIAALNRRILDWFQGGKMSQLSK